MTNDVTGSQYDISLKHFTAEFEDIVKFDGYLPFLGYKYMRGLSILETYVYSNVCVGD